MQSTSRKFFCPGLALFFYFLWVSATYASETRAVSALSERLLSSTAFGVGVVTWGAVARTGNGHAQLFTYQIEYAKNEKIIVCTERELHPGQRVFFAIQINESSQRDFCIPKSNYLPATQFTQIIYAGFDDLLNGKTWFEIPMELDEKFDCNQIEVVSTSVDVRASGIRNRVEIRGVPGAGNYFSGESLMKCLKSWGLPQYKTL